MSTHKRIDGICIAGILLALGLTALLLIGAAGGVIPVAGAGTESGLFTAADLNASWDTEDATRIELSDEGSVVKGNGAYVHEGDIHIAYGGHYVLTGELTEGSVIIDADKSDRIWILLDQVQLHCSDYGAIRVEQAEHVYLTLAEGTENTISSGELYREEALNSGVDGVIYSRDDLTINGEGSLAINAGYAHGIVCNDDLVIAGGHIQIDAVQDGIHANDSVCIRDCAISISAGDDGISVSNDDETAFLYVESGTISIPSCYEGLEAVEITIAGGTIDLWPTDDGINASGSGGSVIRITGGDIRITNPAGRDADGLDSNGDIYIEGGTLRISVTDSGANSALDYGSESGGECVISGGTVIACGGSAMAEGFSADSPQGFFMYSTAAEEGTVIRLTDSQGEELLLEEIPCSFSSAVISTPKLKMGDICTIAVGGVEEEITVDNVSSKGFVPAGAFGNGMREGQRPGLPESGSRPGREEMPEGEKRPGGPGMGQAGRGMWEQPSGERMDAEGDMQASTVLADPWLLLVISVLALLAGLLIAVKIRGVFIISEA